MALKLLHELCHQHGVLAAGDADGDPVPGADQLVSFYGVDKGSPQGLAEFCDNAALNELTGFPFTGQGYYLTFSFFSLVSGDRGN